MLQFHGGHAQGELVMAVGKAGEVVNLPGEIIAVVQVGGSGDDDGGGGSGRFGRIGFFGGGIGALGQAGVREGGGNNGEIYVS